VRRRSLSSLLKPPRGFRLTKSGALFFAFLLATILASMVTGNNLLFLILACLLAFMIVSGIESELNIRHLQVARSLPSEIFANRAAMVTYTVRNPRRDSTRLYLVDRARLKLPAVTRAFPESVRQAVVFGNRGRHRLGRVSIATTYPYGLFDKSISFDLEDEVIVFPGPVPCDAISPHGPSGEGSGRTNDAISHVRPYATGDPLSSVVWKKSRTGLVSRVMQGGGGAASVVVIHPGGDIEEKLGKAVYLVCQLMASGVSFGVSLNSWFSGMGSSEEHKLVILRTLALTQSVAIPEHRVFPGEVRAVQL
jgi:uncharacterized protein (DUF58 family)